jgi:hypothetical protein
MTVTLPTRSDDLESQPTAVAGAYSSPITDYLNYLYNEFTSVSEGNVATYIPELAKADTIDFQAVRLRPRIGGPRPAARAD